MNQIELKTNYLIDRAFRGADLNNRSRAILEKRFGLKAPEIFTLQELGNEYGVSRERIRQIEERGLKKIQDELKKNAEMEAIVEFIKNYLSFHGGLKRRDLLVYEFYCLFRPDNEQDIFGNELRFIYEALQYPYFAREDEHYYDFWYLEEEIYQKMRLVQKGLIQRLKRVEHFEKILSQLVQRHNITEPTAMNYLSVSKRFGVGPYGDIGLMDWEEINPKTVRAKIYLELKRSGKSMHFTEIARLINCHTATVHNELIKDKRFKLVGRGIYALEFYQ